MQSCFHVAFRSYFASNFNPAAHPHLFNKLTYQQLLWFQSYYYLAGRQVQTFLRCKARLQGKDSRKPPNRLAIVPARMLAEPRLLNWNGHGHPHHWRASLIWNLQNVHLVPGCKQYQANAHASEPSKPLETEGCRGPWNEALHLSGWLVSIWRQK